MNKANHLMWILVAALFCGRGFANSPPFVTSPIPDTSMSQGDSLLLDLSNHFGNFTHSKLEYLVKVTPDQVTGKSNINGKLTLRSSSEWAGRARVIVTAINTEQEIAMDTFSVEIAPGPGLRSPKDLKGPTENNLALVRFTHGGFWVRTVENRRVKMRLVNSMGHRLAEYHLAGSCFCELPSALPKGVYYAHIFGDGVWQALRFVLSCRDL